MEALLSQHASGAWQSIQYSRVLPSFYCIFLVLRLNVLPTLQYFSAVSCHLLHLPCPASQCTQQTLSLGAINISLRTITISCDYLRCRVTTIRRHWINSNIKQIYSIRFVPTEQKLVMLRFIVNCGNPKWFTGNRKWSRYVNTIYLNHIRSGPGKNVYWVLPTLRCFTAQLYLNVTYFDNLLKWKKLTQKNGLVIFYVRYYVIAANFFSLTDRIFLLTLCQELFT